MAPFVLLGGKLPLLKGATIQITTIELRQLEKQLGIPVLRRDLPVLLLYNLDPGWLQAEIDESQHIMESLSTAMQEVGHPVIEVCLRNQDLAGLLRPYSPQEFILFNTCEEIPGIPHSYDLIAQTLEQLGYTFTGADSSALSINQDKRLVKQLLIDSGIATPRWEIFPGSSVLDWKLFPAIVKPALEHCSYGVTRGCVVSSHAELAARIEYVTSTFCGPALVEEFIVGREFDVNILGTEAVFILPIAEIDFSAVESAHDRLCTFQSKFDPLSSDFNLIKTRLPAAMTPNQNQRLKHAAKRVYKATHCRDFARLEFRLSEGTFLLLDVNPNADISPGYSAALAAEQIGLSYGMLGSLLVNLAAQRHPLFGQPNSQAAEAGPRQYSPERGYNL